MFATVHLVHTACPFLLQTFHGLGVHTQGPQIRFTTQNCLTRQRMVYQPEDMFGTRLLDLPTQDSSLVHNRPWSRSHPSHHDKRRLELDFGYSSPMHLLSGHLNGKNGIKSSEPDSMTNHHCRPLSEGDSAGSKRCFADNTVSSKHSKTFSECVDSCVHQSQLLSKAVLKRHQGKTPSTSTEACCTTSPNSEMLAPPFQLTLYLLDLTRKMLERETFPSRDRTAQISVDLKAGHVRQNISHEQSNGGDVSPTDASDIKHDQSSQRPLSTSEHHNQQKKYSKGSNHGKREDGKDEGEDDSHGGESPGQNARRLSETETSSRQFACPYQKRFSGLLPNSSSCSFLGFTTVDLMK